MARPLHVIAREIAEDWPNPGHAQPYLEAMFSLRTLGDWYGADDAESIVMYFLTNAGQWKGPKAREIKKELRQMLKKHSRRASATRVASRHMRSLR